MGHGAERYMTDVAYPFNLTYLKILLLIFTLTDF